MANIVNTGDMVRTNDNGLVTYGPGAAEPTGSACMIGAAS